MLRALAAAALAAAAAAAAPKPHVVLFLADDYGWGNLGVHRRGDDGTPQTRAEVHTPNLDGLIDNGILLDQHYAYKICSPSRSSLQSGRLAVHVNVVNTGVTVANTSDPVSGYAGVPRNMTGMAQKLRSAGYRTHMVGKWDAGMATPEHTPLGRGYESFLGYFQHANDYWRKSMPLQSTGEVDNCLNSFADFFMHNETYRGGVRDGISSSPGCLNDPNSNPACYEEYLFNQRALEVVQNHDLTKADEPLFLFYAFHLLHTPLQVPDSYLKQVDSLLAGAGARPIDSQQRRLYAAMTLYMDEAVGNVVEALKSRGMWDNTLIVFTADNGGPIYEPGAANNHPLKGGKYSDWQGGVRVNAFLSGGFVPQSRRGSRYSGVISIADWYATLCELAGVDSKDEASEQANVWLAQQGLPLLPPVDSIPVWDLVVSDSPGRPSLHLSEQAILEWPYKLVVGRQPYSRWQGDQFPNCTTVKGYEKHGPAFTELKMFDQVIPLTSNKAFEDRITWVQDCGDGCLFNVEADPTEHMDLGQDPAQLETKQRLAAKLQELNKGLFQPGRGQPMLQACEVMVDNGGYYGPYLGAEGWYTVVPQTPGQHQKDQLLKQVLRTVNREGVEKGLVAIADLFMPLLRKSNNSMFNNFDKCLGNGTAPATANEAVPSVIQV